MKILSSTDIVVDILKKHGEWMESSLFLEEVMKKRNVSDRQAYRDIKGACEADKVRKVELPDDTVYGLSNWPFPTITSKKQSETLTFKEAFKYRVFKNLGQISNENIEGNSLKAWQYVKHQTKMLPKQQKKTLTPLMKKGDVVLAKTKGVDFYTTEIARRRVAKVLVEEMIDEISTVLHES